MSIEVFKWKGFKLPKVIIRKLGKEQAHGIYDGVGTIEIDERLKGKKLLEIYAHEALHAIQPSLSEEEVIKVSRFLTEFLWRENYRKIDNHEK